MERINEIEKNSDLDTLPDYGHSGTRRTESRGWVKEIGGLPLRRYPIHRFDEDSTDLQEVTRQREGRMEKLRAFLRDESGQDLVEYAMLLALIVLAALAGVGGFGGNAGEVWSHIATTTAGYMGS